MKLAIGYSSKNQLDLTQQTWPRLLETVHGSPGVRSSIDLYWCDASSGEALNYFTDQAPRCQYAKSPIKGGADAAIAWKLYNMLNSTDAGGRVYTHIGLLENDVLLDPDWLAPTLELFEKGKADGLTVGAVSLRSYFDRVLIQRDGYAAMHNIGAGAIIFTREAAEIVLRSFRTNWWPVNRLLFAQLSGIDLAVYAAFRGQEQWVTTDWGWEAQLASHGLASLACTPARCQMIGQNPPLEQQGLRLVAEGDYSERKDGLAFELYRDNLARLRHGLRKSELPGIIHRDGSGMLIFPHQLGHLEATWQGHTRLKWSQGFGPFAYMAGPGGASVSVRVSGSCSFLASGGASGARVSIADTRSGFSASPNLPPEQGGPVAMSVPGGPITREVRCELEEGGVFYGLSTVDPQILNDKFSFNWKQLPEAE